MTDDLISVGTTSYISKKLRKNDWYKYEVQAYRIVDGKKVVFGRSLQLYAATKGSKKYANRVAVRIAGSKTRTLKVEKIITKKPGHATVYVVTQNGVMAKIKVKVRK